MGTDIHMHIEVLKDGQWQYFDWREPSRIGEYEDGEPRYDWEVIFESPFYLGRNYNLFAILADVRNGRGFAGCDTGDGFNPIDGPRGLPDDVTSEVLDESNGWGLDGHSHSWFSLAELQDYDYEQVTGHRGWVNLAEYQQFKTNGKPTSWSGGVSGSKVRHVSNNFMDALSMLEAEELSMLTAQVGFYTQVEWSETYRESVGESWFNFIAELEKLGDCRIVFWFDN